MFKKTKQSTSSDETGPEGSCSITWPRSMTSTGSHLWMIDLEQMNQHIFLSFQKNGGGGVVLLKVCWLCWSIWFRVCILQIFNNPPLKKIYLHVAAPPQQIWPPPTHRQTRIITVIIIIIQCVLLSQSKGEEGGGFSSSLSLSGPLVFITFGPAAFFFFVPWCVQGPASLCPPVSVGAGPIGRWSHCSHQSKLAGIMWVQQH